VNKLSRTTNRWSFSLNSQCEVTYRRSRTCRINLNFEHLTFTVASRFLIKDGDKTISHFFGKEIRMLRICAATLMLLFIAGCSQSTDPGAKSAADKSAAEVPSPGSTDSPDTDAAMVDLVNATEVVVTVPGME